MLAQKTQSTVLITEEDKILAEHPDPPGDVIEGIGGCDDQPVAAEPVSSRGSGADMGNVGECNTAAFYFTPGFHGRDFFTLL